MRITRGHRGFTLIEVLVLAAIIALLVAILLPALHRSRETTKSVVCLSNLMNIGLAMKAYQGDYRGWLPVGPADKLWYVDRQLGIVREPGPNRRPLPWTNCHWGGKRAAWNHDVEHTPPRPEVLGRPLTRYLYKKTGLDHPTPVFECPADVGNPLCVNPVGDLPFYYLCGNSYYTNAWESFDPVGERRPSPSNVVLVEEGTMFMDMSREQQNRGWHGRFSVHNALFLDFHAEARYMDTRSDRGVGWFVENYISIMDYYRY